MALLTGAGGGGAPIANLQINVYANITQVNNAFTQLNQNINNFQRGFQQASVRIAAAGEFLGRVLFSSLQAAGRAMAGAFTGAIENAKNLNNALVSLVSVARAFGVSSDAAMAAAKRLSADGLLPLRDSAQGLSNLLLTGFNLEQSIGIMNAFKDSASFARQESYSFADAVRTATEGLRNNRSAVVDNVGLTKNLSVMMKEGGFVLQDLTDKYKGATARQHLYLAILRETASQQGAAERSLKTYAGAVTALSSAYISLSAELGNMVVRNPAVMIGINALAGAMRTLTTYLVDNQRGMDLVTDGLVLFVRTLAAVVTAIDIVHRAFRQFDSLVRGFVYTIADAVNEVSGLMLSLVVSASKVPGASAVLMAGFSQQIVDLSRLSIESKKITDRMSEGILKNDAALAKWNPRLTDAANALLVLADKMAATKGTMLQLEDAARPAGDRIDALAESAEEAAKKLEKALKLIDKLRPGFQLGLSGRIGEQPWLPKIPQEALNMMAMLKAAPTYIDGIVGRLPGVAVALRKMYDPVYETLKKLKFDLPNILLSAFESGSLLDGITRAAGAIGDRFTRGFQDAIKTAIGENRKLTGAEQLMGLAGIGLESFAGGVGIGAKHGRTMGALGGAASGALAGLPFAGATGGLSIAVGAGVGFFGGLVGGGMKKADERRALSESKQALLNQYGGMEKLNKLAEKLGISMATAFATDQAVQFNKSVENLNAAIARQKTHLEGLAVAVDAVNQRAALFGAQFATFADQPDKIAETAQRVQPEFERLGLMIRDTFAGLVRETGSAISALRQLEPAFKVLDQAVADFGLTNSAVTDELLANYRLVTDEGFKPMFEAIEASGAILKGLSDAGALSPDTFQALATDIGASLQGIIDKGGDMHRTLALSQPVLQTLWEAQQTYGAITDATTLSLLAEAEAQGLVGDTFKNVNEKILDVLLAIGKVIGADLPSYFDKLVGPAEDAAQGIEDAFSDIDIPPVTIPYIWEGPDGSHSDMPNPGDLPGGGVRQPTLTTGGRGRGIVPLAGAGLGVSGGNYVTDLYLDSERIARSTAKKMPKILRGMGV